MNKTRQLRDLGQSLWLEAYDEGIRDKASEGKSGEALFLELALENLRRARTTWRRWARRWASPTLAMRS